MSTALSICLKMPPQLCEAAVTAVEQRDTSMNELIVGELSKHYGLPHSSHRSRRGYPARDKLVVCVRMTAELKRAIQLDALTAQSNMTDTIVAVLANALGVQLPETQPRRTTPFGGGPRGRRRHVQLPLPLDDFADKAA